ncbi:ABC transporter ATP-binding protein [Candidatus Bathyarchaeota archaeon]|nr:ABC transporter ATP-binding protein [Candidatus Bathyarchaeota archaeon]MBS7628708.1 ABC transporter ATP-binding protein [Candidatus Bathyarchaeota archaeon]
MSEILEVSNLSFAYGQAQVLFNINIRTGGFVTGVVGRNGAGKTTLLKAIAGLEKPIGGKVLLGGTDITGLPAWKISKLGISYVPQDKRVFTSLTTYEHLLIAANAKIGKSGDVESEIEKAMEYFPRLRVVKDSKASNLSGGERQMLNIAMALFGSTKLLMLDEPTEGLAPALTRTFGEFLKEKSREVPMILVEQNVPLLKDVCDRVYVLEEGRIIHEEKSRDEVQEGGFAKYL